MNRPTRGNAAWARPSTSSTEAGSLQLGGELLDLPAGLLELIERRGVGDAEIGPQAEGAAVHHGDAFLVQKLGDEVLVGRDHSSRRRLLADRPRAGRIDIERAFQLRALLVLGLAEHRHKRSWIT